jgi:myo-inositol-1(or 4)-monophosphatase
MQHFLKTIIKEAGEIGKEYFVRGVSHKEKSHAADLVTEADIAVSEFLVKKIRETYPDHHIKSEELADDINPGAEYEWVIDPIDGTRNFAMGVPFWTTLIAVLRNGETYLGAAYNAFADQLFFAEKGAGAFMNDVRLHVNNKDQLDYAFGVFSRAYEGGIYGDYFERYRVAGVRLVLETKAWMHNYGCMLALCHLASGGADFAMGNAGMDWDFLAPFLICEEAGAIVTDSDGNPWKRGRQDYLVANKDLHPQLLELFQPKEK